jgi:CoA:oxalate CoA-transferase
MIQPDSDDGPLAGVRVIDLGRYQAAPRCAAVLARLGADVIKVEPPGGDESRAMGPHAGDVSIYWAQHNAGKRSLAVDLRKPEGRRLVERLVAVSDVVVENFRPGVFEDMGLGYQSLRRLNRRIIVVHVSGFGRTGRSAERLAFDQVGQAMSGFMSLNGDPAGPPTISPFPFVDRITALHAAIATLAALLERAVSGEGQELDVTLGDAAYSAVELPIAAYLRTGDVPSRAGNATSLGNMYEASDGHVYVADYGGDRIFPRLARALGRPEWAGDPRFGDRSGRAAHSGVIEAAIIEWFGGRTAADAVELLGAAGIACAVVNDIPAAAREPFFKEAAPMAEVGDGAGDVIAVPGSQMRFSRSRVRTPGPVPRVGEHSTEVLRQTLGMTDPEIAGLLRDGVIS